jgi:uncharacterized protein (DUF1330 family)
MSVYAIVQLSIRDRPRYDRYSEALPAVLDQYGGRLLVADDEPRVLEGEWSGNRVVLLEFDDRAAFRAFAGSPEYQVIVGDRLASGDTVTTLVRGRPA